MRLRQNRMRTYYVKAPLVLKDNEGSVYNSYGDAIAFDAEVFPDSDTYESKMYGLVPKSVLKMICDNNFEHLQVGSGVCVNVGELCEPDYIIGSVMRYEDTHYKHFVIRLVSIEVKNG